MAKTEQHSILYITRPFPVTIILWLGLILSATRTWEAWALFQQIDTAYLWEINLTWRLFGALLWALLFAILTVALWANKPFTYHTFPTLLLIHTLYNFGWRQLTPTRPSGWLTPLVVGLALTAVTALILHKQISFKEEEI